VGNWQVLLVEEVADWSDDLTRNDPGTADLIEDAVDRLASEGPRWADHWSTGSAPLATTT